MFPGAFQAREPMVGKCFWLKGQSRSLGLEPSTAYRVTVGCLLLPNVREEVVLGPRRSRWESATHPGCERHCGEACTTCIRLVLCH